MVPQSQQDDEKLVSLAVILPLAVSGFVIAASCWTLFAVAGVHLRAGLGLSNVQFGTLLAMPMAVGALLAIPAGIAAQRFGARAVMLWCLGGLAACMGLLLLVKGYWGYLLVASGLGLAGGFYSAGLQFVVSHSRVARLGLVLGLFGSGVAGAAFSYYLVPLFHTAFSWQAVPLVYLIVLLVLVALLLMLTDQDPVVTVEPQVSPLSRVTALLWSDRFLPLAIYFGVVAGSFFALALWLPDFLSGQFSLPLGKGAGLAQWFVVPGALAQIAGGGLSDRYGSTRVAIRSMAVCLVSLALLSYPPMTLIITGVNATIEFEFALPLVVEGGLIVLLGVAMGSAMGSLQRLVIMQNRSEASLAAGILLVVACSVAFVLPVLFGAVNQWLGVRTAMFMILFLLLSASLVLFAHDSRVAERSRFLQRGV